MQAARSACLRVHQGEECSTGKQVGPEIVRVCACDLEMDFPGRLWTLGQLSVESGVPHLLPLDPPVTALTPMFLHPRVPGQPGIISLSNVSLDHLIGLRF